VTQREKAQELRRLHQALELLVLPNVWDAASARTVAALPACRALATGSGAIAAAHGLPDGGAIGADAMCAAVAVIARAVDVPVTADLEDGYGDAGATVAMALEAGAVGCNLEDRCGDPAEHVERVAAARAAGETAGVPLVINARTDGFLVRPGGDPEERLADAIARGRLYLDAGADCVFAIGAKEPADLRAMSNAFGGRLSVFATPDFPPLAELAELGVMRVTFGSGLMGAAYGELGRTAEELLTLAASPERMRFRPPGSV
jgi:2-methylisocitrate lyase-like PEP mutase family enzyme